MLAIYHKTKKPLTKPKKERKCNKQFKKRERKNREYNLRRKDINFTWHKLKVTFYNSTYNILFYIGQNICIKGYDSLVSLVSLYNIYKVFTFLLFFLSFYINFILLAAKERIYKQAYKNCSCLFLTGLSASLSSWLTFFISFFLSQLARWPRVSWESKELFIVMCAHRNIYIIIIIVWRSKRRNIAKIQKRVLNYIERTIAKQLCLFKLKDG